VNSFPERLDIYGTVQFEERPLQRRIDDQFMLADKPSVSPHVPPPLRTHQKTTLTTETFNKSLDEIATKVTSRSSRDSSKLCEIQKPKKKGTKI
jgi:hypothetical protein